LDRHQGVDNVELISESYQAAWYWRGGASRRRPSAIRAFYCDVLGFPIVRVLHDSIAFIRVADGVEGHTRVMGLFSKDRQAAGDGETWDGWNPRLSTLHHFAIEISLEEYENVVHHLAKHKLNPSTAAHDWIGWRSIYVSDPDNNIVEFVSYDASVLRSEKAGARAWPLTEAPRRAGD
jgi:catechol 2,3-dioxygenase